ncbi:MAG: hypothetical protein WBW88_02970, partial [Rhodothermales bacterium]
AYRLQGLQGALTDHDTCYAPGSRGFQTQFVGPVRKAQIGEFVGTRREPSVDHRVHDDVLVVQCHQPDDRSFRQFDADSRESPRGGARNEAYALRNVFSDGVEAGGSG